MLQTNHSTTGYHIAQSNFYIQLDQMSFRATESYPKNKESTEGKTANQFTSIRNFNLTEAVKALAAIV